MILNRLKLLPALSVNATRCFSTSKQMKAGGHGVYWYRSPRPLPPTKTSYYFSMFVTSFMWWWIFWHVWTDHAHITGEFQYPDPAKWTDEELGIPPDEE